jgi:putative transposase
MFSNKRPAHGVKFVEGQPTVIFDTICTKNRSPWLATPEVHSLLIETWSKANLWLVGRYVIMPDHIHLFAWETEDSIPYENWVKYWKSQFTKMHKQPAHQWQADHWDTRMRTFETYESKWYYVRQNPVRAELVSETDQWPFQGELHRLEWGS